MSGYLVVMVIMIAAIVAVLIALFTDRDEAAETSDETAGELTVSDTGLSKEQ